MLDEQSQHFLELLDDDNKLIKSSYTKDGLWLKYFKHSNLLCVRASRTIVNHAPIGKYQLKFFSQEEFKYSYSHYPIEIRQYILYKYRRYNKYWNLRRDTIAHFILFLEFNNNAFSFGESIT